MEMQESIRERDSLLPVYDAERVQEYTAGDMLVLRGFTDALRAQLPVKSREPAILRWTPRDAAERFVDEDSIRARELDTYNYPLVQKGQDGSLDLAGLMWLSPRPKHGANFTYAVRLYKGYERRGLAERLTNTGIADFSLLHPKERSIWLETDIVNESARKLYEKTGWQSIIRGDTREVMTKLLDAKNPKIVVIGGGTGSFTVLGGLKRYTEGITAVVNMSDDGGSSGKLRDEYGVLPPGDIRQCLVALSDSDFMRDMFEYRFEGGRYDEDPLGNIILSGVEQMLEGDFEQGLRELSNLFNIHGQVVPVTVDKSKLHAKLSDGVVIDREERVGHMTTKDERPEIWLEPASHLTESARQAIEEADIVVIAPGNLYGSLAPALIVKGIKEALESTKAKKVYVSNLVTKPGQTEGFKVHDFADEIERFIGAKVLDYVIFNNDEPTRSTRNRYVRQGEEMLEFDLDVLNAAHYQAVGLPMIDKKPVVHKKGDSISSRRTLIRHDGDLLAKEVIKLLSR